jgi:hypothetical protein
MIVLFKLFYILADKLQPINLSSMEKIIINPILKVELIGYWIYRIF